jgi:hypothetical protein
MAHGVDFLVSRTDLATTQLAHSALAPGTALADGDVLFVVDRFAVTANNITYADQGEDFGYWSFFPAADGWGRIPAWGFVTALASRHPGIAAGEQFYGYVPMSTYVVMQPQRVGEGGFVDGVAHRAPLHPLYSQYVRTANDPLYDPELADHQLLLRPLFITSFVLDLVLAQAQLHGARTIVISSASSKTAYGLAFLLTQRALEQRGYAVLGLTSARNLAFVGTLGVYDRVLDYDALATLDERAPTVYVDFIASQAVRAGLRARLGGALVREYLVGFLSRETSDVVPFFAPDVIRAQATALGRAVFAERFAAAWRAFVQFVAHHPAEPLRVRAERGGAALERVYDALLAGTLSPRDGVVLTLVDED